MGLHTELYTLCEGVDLQHCNVNSEASQACMLCLLHNAGAIMGSDTADVAPQAEGDAAAEQAFVSALQHVETYMQLHEAACSRLKQGWFNIARARHAMGVHQASVLWLLCPGK